jgi:thiol-disulfide isomerase/thioredoxin
VLQVKLVMGVWVAVAAASFGSQLLAQDGDAPVKKPAPVRRFFDRPIDYWGRGLGYQEESKGAGEKPPELRPAPARAPSEWGQVVTLPDGTLSYHELPRPLVDVLENPSPENIRAYFAFRLSKTQKILRAAELMKEYRASVGGQAGESAPATPGAPPSLREAPGRPEEKLLQSSPAEKPVKPSPFTVTYFHKKHCPHCDSQDVVLTEWLKDKPEAKLEVIEFGTKPELWQAYQVRGTPTLLIADSTTKETVFLEGLQRAEALDRSLGECRSGNPPGAAPRGEKQK